MAYEISHEDDSIWIQDTSSKNIDMDVYACNGEIEIFVNHKIEGNRGISISRYSAYKLIQQLEAMVEQLEKEND